MKETLSKCVVLNDIMGSDHFPLLLDLNLPNKDLPPKKGKKETNLGTKNAYDWRKTDLRHKNQYAWEITNILNDTLSPVVFECEVDNCKNEGHKRDLQGICTFLNEVMTYCEKKTIPEYKRGSVQGGKKCIVGWSELVKNKYKEYQNVNREWINEGRKREGKIFELRKEKQNIYKSAVRYCKKNERQIKIKKIIENNRNLNAVGFWKEINKIRKESKQYTSRIDGICDSKEICKKWRKFMETGEKIPSDSALEMEGDGINTQD